MASGLTPAYAGNTIRGYVQHEISWAHPRIRGEYSVLSDKRYDVMGSPPHTRGIHIADLNDDFGEGLTPAYAGNTDFAYQFVYVTQAHPRIRGEYKSRRCASYGGIGSPPHTRGILDSHHWSRRFTRLTPAYAGNTGYRWMFLRKSQAHPRIRGEYLRHDAQP